MSRLFSNTLRSLLFAGALSSCMAGGGTDAGQDTQRIVGSIPLSSYSSNIIGLRVLAGDSIIAASAVDSAGNFAIEVPRGKGFSVELLSEKGSYTVLTGPLDGATPLTFDVCEPGAAFDIGGLSPLDFEEIDGDPVPWGNTEDNCEVPNWICGSNADPADCLDEPLPCSDTNADPSFCWDEPLPCGGQNADPSFCEPPPGPGPGPCNANDGSCEPPPGPGPGPCNANDGSCEPPPGPPPCGPNRGNCEPPPAASCDSPNADPAQCIDPAPVDCVGGAGSNVDPSCWPAPDVCTPGPNGNFEGCDGSNGAAPSIPFPDFGCGI